jgi:hypothetical protein
MIGVRGTSRRTERALAMADLSGQPGLTAGSLRMWGATRDVVDIPTAVRGAALAGVHPFTLHRLVTQHGERAWRN